MLSNVRPVPLLVGSVVVCGALTGLIWVLGGRLDEVALLPDQGASWYYWKLPEPTVLSRATAWGGYVLHQFTLWLLIFYAQTRVRRYSSGLHPVNVVALAANVGFVGLHLLQTHLFYDGLAQDVSIFSSQGSVVLLLVVVLLMENRRRGLFFGRRVPFRAAVIDFARRYHGYLFSWAAVYTFWYHPAVNTSGHLIGFFYLFLLLVQGSLFLTRAHTNRIWTFTLEIMVAVHGTLVAVMNSGPDGMWPMFLFGFLGVFVITQLHGLGLSRKARAVVIIGYLVAAIAVYAARGRLLDLHEIIRIPLIEYGLVFVVAGLVWLGLWVRDRRRPRSPSPEVQVSPAGRTRRSAGPTRPGTPPDR